MRSLASSARRWRALAGAAALSVLLATMALVPPGTLPYPPRSTYSDAQVSHWPNAYFLREAVLGQHTWPLWNPMRMLGQPFAANPLAKVWYPPQWLVLIFPPTTHLDLLLYLHMAWLALGMVTWARAERRRTIAALFVALAWGLNPKLAGHLGAGHLDIVYALSWVPWVMWSAHHLVERPSVARGALLGALGAMLALADLRIAAYFIPVAAIYALSAALPLGNFSGLLKSAAAALLVLLLLTAVEWIPLLAIGPYLTRAAITPAEAAEFSLPPNYLLGLVLPDLGGQHEWMTAMGLPVIVLAFFALRNARCRRQAAVWWGVVLLAGLWALGSFGPLFLPAVRLVPALTWLRVPSRAWFVVDFGMIALAGVGLEALITYGPGRWSRLAAMGLAVAGLALLGARLVIPALPGVISTVGGALIGTGGGLWIAGLGEVDGVSAKPARGALIGAGALLSTLVLSLIGLNLTLVVPRTLPEVEAPEKAIVSHLDPGCAFVYSPTFELIGPGTAEAGVVTLHGVDPFELRGSAQAIAAAAGTNLHGYSVIAPPMPPGETDLSRTRPDVALLRQLGVCDVVSSFPLSVDGLEQTSSQDGVRIYHVMAGTASATADTALAPWRPVVYGYTPDSTRVCVPNAKPDAKVFIQQSWAPGWQAWLDGKRVDVVPALDGAAMSADVAGAGCHTLELAYRPTADLAGLAVTGVAAAALLGWWVAVRRRRADA